MDPKSTFFFIILIGAFVGVVCWLWQRLSIYDVLSLFFKFESELPIPIEDVLIIAKRMRKYEKWVGKCSHESAIRENNEIDLIFKLKRTKETVNDSIYTKEYFDDLCEKLMSDVLGEYLLIYGEVVFQITFSNGAREEKFFLHSGAQNSKVLSISASETWK